MEVPLGKGGNKLKFSGISCVVPAVVTVGKVTVASPTLVLTTAGLAGVKVLFSSSVLNTEKSALSAAKPVGVVAVLSFPAIPALKIEVISTGVKAKL